MKPIERCQCSRQLYANIYLGKEENGLRKSHIKRKEYLMKNAEPVNFDSGNMIFRKVTT
jgi:hypothetical protein